MYTVRLTPQAGVPFHTQQIQLALDACREEGGEVFLQAGEWRIASLRLYSNTTLHLCAGAHVTASDRWQDYTDWGVPTTLGYVHSPTIQKIWNIPAHYVNAPVTAFLAENVAVIGEEDSWFDGADCFDPNGEEKFRGPMGMVFCRCKNVTLQGYTYKNSANWCHQLDSCTNVHMKNVTVLAGHDGINVHHCTGVWIEDCDFQTGDDCVAGYNVENLVVRRCRLNTSCSGFRIGARHLLVEDCTFWGPGVYPHRVSGRHNTLRAFEYYAMTYDTCERDSEDWVIQNCTFDTLDSFIHYDYGRDWMHSARPLRDVTFRNLQIRGLCQPSQLRTLPEAPLLVTVENVSVTWRNGLPAEGLVDISPAVTVTTRALSVEGLTLPTV